MKRLILILVSLAALAVAQESAVLKPDAQTNKERPAQAEPKSHSSGQAATAGAPDRALMQRIADAWATLNPDNAAPFYAKDPELVFYDIEPLKAQGWQQYAQNTREGFAPMQSIKLTVNDDAQVHTGAQGALGTATCHMDLVMKDGSRQSMDTRWTVVWEKRGTQWLIVHEHYSAPIQAPPPAQK